MKEKIRNFCSRVSIGEGGPDPRERALDSMVPERGLSRVVVVGPGGWTRLLCVSHVVCQTSRHMDRISGTVVCFFRETVSYVQQPSRVRRTYRDEPCIVSAAAHDPRASLGPEMRTNTVRKFHRAGMGRFPGDSDVFSSVRTVGIVAFVSYVFISHFFVTPILPS
jgi:hypothetical protein